MLSESAGGAFRPGDDDPAGHGLAEGTEETVIADHAECLTSQCHHRLQDVGCGQKCSATRRALRNTIEQSPKGGRPRLLHRAFRGVLQRV